MLIAIEDGSTPGRFAATTSRDSRRQSSCGCSPYSARKPLTKTLSVSMDPREDKDRPGFQIGRFVHIDPQNDLIIQITEKMLSGRPLSSMRLEELKVLRLRCVLLFHRGVETLLLRETLHNSGVGDNGILNRKISFQYWQQLYRYITRVLRDAQIEGIFNETRAAQLSASLASMPTAHGLLCDFVRDQCGIAIRLPRDMTQDGNFLFSLGTVYCHRFFRMARFFTKHWGEDQYEPAMRLLCQKMWMLSLLSDGKLRVSRRAFRDQRFDHELGLYNFLIQDCRTFTGTLYRNPPPLPPVTYPEVNDLTNASRIPTLC
ncbi:GP79 [Caviid betaherpesvirus 2]|uniref:GP79 n=1 Tax=Guinea pig cytomegalovirus (strain 22122) TaxID=103920 RepID=B7TPY5_GPCMV|nr:GP79 [Caviid betaherpesvirus 2]AGE11549.1 GP79 [Caviid betaherpesvirus 2]AIL83937.1 GP79 [BAC cloning vector GPN13BACdenovo_preserved(MM)]BAJ78537.1 GP79 [Caviid betaherpesvirus 2]